MNTRWGGYTIVEVMIVMAVSMIMFASVASVMGSQQKTSQFTQATKDLNSRVQAWVSDVASGVYPASNSYGCALDGNNRPVITASSSGLGSNSNCVFLGKAIQVIVGQSLMYSYTVLGSRTSVSATGQATPSTSFSTSSPSPAFGGAADFVDQFDLSYGTKVLSANAITTSGTTVASSLVGFYNSLQDGYAGGTADSNQSINMKQYNFTDNTLASAKSSALKACIEQTSCTAPTDIVEWDVCMQAGNGTRTAKLVLKSTPTGINSYIDYGVCT